MPYILEKDRRQALFDPSTAGELNFSVSTTIDDFIGLHGISYDTFNTIIGVLECAKLEIYRRQVAEYEDVKLHQNGEVYVKTMEAKNVRASE